MTAETIPTDQRIYDERERAFLERVEGIGNLNAISGEDALGLGREYLSMMPLLIQESSGHFGVVRMPETSKKRILEFGEIMEASDNGDHRELKFFLIKNGIFHNKQALSYGGERMKALGRACYAIGSAMPAYS